MLMRAGLGAIWQNFRIVYWGFQISEMEVLS